MIFAHLPAGYLVTYFTRKIWQSDLSPRRIKWLYLIGTVAGVLPDFDIFYFYLVNAQGSHRELVTHTVIPYLIVLALGLIFGRLLKNKLLSALGIVILAGALSHLVLDSLNSGIGWFYPASKLIYGLYSIPALAAGWYGQQQLVINFSLELIIFLLAGNLILFRCYRKRTPRYILLAGSIVLLLGWIVTLVYFNPRLYHRPADIYYSDLDQDQIANKNDDDLDGDKIINIQDPDANGNNISNRQELVPLAQSLAGLQIDFTDKNYWGMLSRFGFISQTEVVTRSYDQIGIYLAQEMERDFNANPSGYLNTPRSERFISTTGNYYVYCQHQGFLKEISQARLGDIVFSTTNEREINQIAVLIEKSDQQLKLISIDDPTRLGGKVGIETMTVKQKNMVVAGDVLP